MRESLEDRAQRGAALLRRELGGGPWQVCPISRAADGQAVFAYRSDERSVIGKLVPDGSAAHSFRLLQQLAAVAFDHLQVPRPLIYASELTMLFTERVAGEPCEGMSLRGAEERLSRIGGALRELHDCTVEFGEIKGLGDHVRELIRPHPQVLADALPALAGPIQACLEMLQARALAWENGPHTLLHRDFHLRQLFDDGSRIAVVDWDLAARGDPAFDVAYFATYLKNHYPEAESAGAVEAFLNGYGADHAIRSRLPVYACFNYLRRACRRYRLRDAGWHERLQAMLTRLDQQLQALS